MVAVQKEQRQTSPAASSLEVDRVAKRYGRKLAVDGVSFAARPGRVLGLLGPNGAGKTSILRMICNITLPDAGEVRLAGRRVGRREQSRIGYMPEERGLYRQASVVDQLAYVARLKGLSGRQAGQAANRWLAALEASEWRHKRPRELSRGMQQKVQFALALVHSPALVILDEPFSGLDPLNSALMEQVIRERAADGAIVLFASHRLEQVEDLCDEICLIADGQVLVEGDLMAVKRGFGRNAVRLDYAGSGGFLRRLADEGRVDILSEREGRAELRLGEGCTGAEVLDAAQAETDELHHFSVNYPSLREIFVREVEAARAEQAEAPVETRASASP